MITKERAAALVIYDAESGELFWRCRPQSEFTRRRLWITWNKRWAGKPAGTFLKSKYRSVCIDGYVLLAHRLIWLLVHGEFPVGDIDHVNGKRADNRLENLRAVSRRENLRNSSLRIDNKSAVTGVHWDNERAKWCASIRGDGKSVHLGRYVCKADAISARRVAERQFGFHKNHGKARQ